ncbi:MAG: SdpI family protein [Candidatus Aenigmatarchaeota archaeon]|nr:SdpI family protein [Candidatus Aenigmarchaeota archaeon]
MEKITLSFILIILLSFLFSIYFYPKIPERMATHWNAKGEVDSYLPKAIGIFIIPFSLIPIFIIFYLIPKIDPLKKNIECFRKYYDIFAILFFLFMLSFHIWIILWNVGITINPQVFLPIAFSFLFFYLSILLENAKRNWFVGIRTPWTLSSEKVWKNTHKLGGKLFRIVAILSFIGIFFGKYSWFFILVPVILISIYLILYSYFEYEREIRAKKKFSKN